MLIMTSPAGARLAHLLESKGDAAVARIFIRKQKFRLGVGAVRPDDRTFAHEGRVVLAINARMAKSLAQHRLDVRQTAAGPRLNLKCRSNRNG
jgi:hypothetical protein